MKKILLAFAISFTLMAFNEAQAYPQVGETVVGDEYVKAIDQVVKRNFRIFVSADKGRERIIFSGDNSIGSAYTLIEYNENNVRVLDEVISKALEWAKVAKENKAEAQKPLGCFGMSGLLPVDCDGYAHGANGLAFRFVSGFQGEVIFLSITMVDIGNKYKEATINVNDEPEIRKLLGNIRMIDATMKKERESGKKQNELFK